MTLLDSPQIDANPRDLQSSRREPRAFDHARCPVCDGLMRIMLVEPRNVAHVDHLERHTYACDACHNVSRFTVDTTP